MAKDRAEQTRHEYWLEVAIALKIFLSLNFKQIILTLSNLRLWIYYQYFCCLALKFRICNDDNGFGDRRRCTIAR